MLVYLITISVKGPQPQKLISCDGRNVFKILTAANGRDKPLGCWGQSTRHRMCAVPVALPNVCMWRPECGALKRRNKTRLEGGGWWGGTKERQICNSHEGRVRLTGQSVLSAKAARIPTRAFCCLFSLREFRCLPKSSDAFAKIAKSDYQLRYICVCLSVSPHGIIRFSLEGFSWNFIFEDFSKICPENSIFIKIWLLE